VNILVAGGAGFVGSHACKALARRGFVPVSYDDLSLGRREAVRWGLSKWVISRTRIACAAC
jgi:UDP-arabinose 4-epimerase